jgi:hypothetical protein
VILLLFYLGCIVIGFHYTENKRPGPKPLKGHDTNIRKKVCKLENNKLVERKAQK